MSAVFFVILVLSLLLIPSRSCDSTVSLICITGGTTDNDWFHVEYTNSGCFGEYPYYYSATNSHYVYWNYNHLRWVSYTLLGDDTYNAIGPYNNIDLFNGNGDWSVHGTLMSSNTDPCLEIHATSCSNAIPSTTCNNCVMDAQYICITGQESDNSWFYTQYSYTDCYGQYPYYYSSTNNHYLYWNYNHLRWVSYTNLGDDTYDAIGSYNVNDLFNGNQWSVQGTLMGYNTDTCLEIHASSCAESTITPCHSCNITFNSTILCVTGQTSDNTWFYTEYNYTGCYGEYPYFYSATNSHYLYWNDNHLRWISYTSLGDNTYNAIGPFNNIDLLNGNGEWSVQGAVMGSNTDPCLEFHASICSAAQVSTTCDVCSYVADLICITGLTSDNNWFYGEFAYSGCYGQQPYYHSSTNNQYIYWNYNHLRWISYTNLGDDTYDTIGPYNVNDLFSGNGGWSVQGTVMGSNTDPCLEVHASSCSSAVVSSVCNECGISASSICVSGSTTDNNWFYVEYAYSGCYGQYPYYYSSTNNHYIYWNYNHLRWISYTNLGDDTYDAIGPFNVNDLFSGNGQWSAQGTTMGSNTDPDLVIYDCSVSTTDNPISAPTDNPISSPTNNPVSAPTDNPLSEPTDNPISPPTNNPIFAPTDNPLSAPTDIPTSTPTDNPIFAPMDDPISPPTDNPIFAPTDNPTSAPTDIPTSAPTDIPTSAPTDIPTSAPTDNPISSPTDDPISPPTENPIFAPTDNPTSATTNNPVYSPTDNPISVPTDNPISTPTDNPVSTPTDNPISAPSNNPVTSPTDNPVPTVTDNPVSISTTHPISIPTDNPVSSPTDNPVSVQTDNPTNNPISVATDDPITTPTNSPVPTDNPITTPTDNPLSAPTDIPVSAPTGNPIFTLTDNPVSAPTDNPISGPTNNPLTSATDNPVSVPSTRPISILTDNPASPATDNPVSVPTDNPTIAPTNNPISAPTFNPVLASTDNPVPATSDNTNTTLTPSANPTECEENQSLENEDCTDDGCENGAFSDFTLSFNVCKKQPYIGNRYGLWNGVVDCLCDLSIEGTDYDYSSGLADRRRLKTGNNDCDLHVVKYAMESLTEPISSDCDTNGYRFYFGIQGCGDCVYLTQTLNTIDEMTENQRFDAIGTCAKWVALQIDANGFEELQNVNLQGTIQDDNNECDFTASVDNKRYNASVVIVMVAILSVFWN